MISKKILCIWTACMIFFSTGCASNFEGEILPAGRELVSAINVFFYQNMGHFPKALDELVPPTIWKNYLSLRSGLRLFSILFSLRPIPLSAYPFEFDLLASFH